MWIVVPVKRFSNAKTRLASILSAAERESLAQVMLHDVLDAITRARLASGVVVVSAEVRARYAVERAGGLCLDDREVGLSAAIRHAGAWLGTHGRRSLLMIPGDVPLLGSDEIDHIIEHHQGQAAVSLVPDREHDGTNALAVTPPDAIRYAFGKGSFEAHSEAARAAGIEPVIHTLPGLALDIDNPLDLQTLLTFDRETETLAYLSDSGIARRLVHRHNDGLQSSEIAAASRLL